jgi:hypothetical protein
MAWVVWREGHGQGREYLAGFGRGRGGTVIWTNVRADAREFATKAEAAEARRRVVDRIGAEETTPAKADPKADTKAAPVVPIAAGAKDV